MGSVGKLFGTPPPLSSLIRGVNKPFCCGSKPELIYGVNKLRIAAAAPTLRAQQDTPEAAPPTEAAVLQALQVALDGFTAEAIS